MEEVGSYLSLARSSSATEFAAKMDGAFLVKRPRQRPIEMPAPVAISYATRLTKLDVDPFPNEWRIIPVRKREGNPFPDRISLGRAPNCDVIIRLPSISKLHAHIFLDAAHSYSLADNGAANATFVNGKRLEAKNAVPIHLGDTISLGSIEFEFCDALRLYKVLSVEIGARK
jgi:2',3'-cyclic-nucleotide 2'-phosphodiesterase (5'-nucleotidase family)